MHRGLLPKHKCLLCCGSTESLRRMWFCGITSKVKAAAAGSQYYNRAVIFSLYYNSVA